MLKKESVFIFLIFVSFISLGQEKKAFVRSGSPFMKVYFNYHTNFENIAKMEMKRVYLGYNYKFSKAFSAKANIDVGQIGGKYVAYLKIAQLQYKKGKTTIKAGMIATKQFKVQEKFWGYRYLLKSFQDEYKFNASADLGASIDYQLMENLSIDFIIQNGEGYKHVESTATNRGGMGITFNPVKSLTLRVYSDLSPKSNVKRVSYAGFVGYKYKKKFRIAAEYNYQKGVDFISNREATGFSAYATYNINKKVNVFGRFDMVEYLPISHLAVIDPNPWNLDKNGAGPILGIEYSPVKGIYISTNYRGWQPNTPDSDFESMVYFNFAYQIK